MSREHKRFSGKQWNRKPESNQRRKTKMKSTVQRYRRQRTDIDRDLWDQDDVFDFDDDYYFRNGDTDDHSASFDFER